MLLAGSIISVIAQNKDKNTVALETTGSPKIEFIKTSHDFGNIMEGTQATVEFTFKNTGDASLVLTSVVKSFGCTTPKWTEEPVALGKTGTITVIYDSRNRPGKFTKTVTVKHNGEVGTQFLTISGFVEQNKTAPEPPVLNQSN